MLLAMTCEKLASGIERATARSQSHGSQRDRWDGARPASRDDDLDSTLMLLLTPGTNASPPPTTKPALPVASIGRYTVDTAAEWEFMTKLLLSVQLSELRKLVNKLQGVATSGDRTSGAGISGTVAVLNNVEGKLRDISNSQTRRT
jgi:hypothetical protein